MLRFVEHGNYLLAIAYEEFGEKEFNIINNKLIADKRHTRIVIDLALVKGLFPNRFVIGNIKDSTVVDITSEDYVTVAIKDVLYNFYVRNSNLVRNSKLSKEHKEIILNGIL